MDTHAGQFELHAPTYGTGSFLSPQGVEVSVPLSRLTRHHAVFDVTDPHLVLRTSEALSGFRLQLGGRTAYRGRAIVTRLLEAGDRLIAEAALDGGWVDTAPKSGADIAHWRGAFDGFLSHWQKHHRVLPEFKVLIADMQTFLADMRVWLEEVQSGLEATSSPSEMVTEAEREMAMGLSPHTSGALTNFFERFEALAVRLEPELQPIHRAYARRQLHPQLLCSPFLHRTFHKPLGYAGDFEMVNMIVGDRFAGKSLFARLVNHWFLQQPPAEAHRNRLDYLAKHIIDTTVRAASSRQVARILTLGCGPAHEVQQFVEQQPFADHAAFTLIDFNHETIEHVRQTLDTIKKRHRRSTAVDTIKRSVNQILKDAVRGDDGLAGRFDLVYCAGLFDYLSDPMCRRLSEILYAWVRPGGQLVTTNVDVSNPRRLIMDFVMDWHLIYRDGPQLAALRPADLEPDGYTVESDVTGVNIYFSGRKPHE